MPDEVKSALALVIFNIYLIMFQDLLECVANWNVSVFEPLKFVPAADVKDDLESKGAESDFHKVEEEVRTSQISELLLVFDEKVENILNLQV